VTGDPLPRSTPDLRLLPAALACWAVAGWAVAATAQAAGVAGVGCLPVVLGAAAWSPVRRRGREMRAHLLLVLACVATVLASAGVALAVRGAGPFPAWTAEQAAVEVTGRIASDPRPLAPGPWGAGGERRIALRMAVGSASARGEHRVVDVPILVIGGPAWATAQVGSVVRADGRLAPPAPGDEAAALLSAFGPPRPVAAPPWWWRGTERVRAGLRQAVRGLPDGAGGLLPSLVVGDTSTLTPQVEEDLRASGLTHLTAVSGANVAIVVGSVLAVAALCGLGLRRRALVAALALIGFVVLARPEPSVLRAAVMGCVALGGLIGSRRGRGLPALAASVIVLLVADPWLARTPGFALSVTATGALVLLAPPWARRLQRVLPRPLALAVAVPAAAQAACAPLAVVLQPSVSTVAVPANLLAEPAVLPATVLGVLAALLSLVWAGGAHAVAALGCLATWWITEVAARCARLPGAQLPWVPGAAGALLLAAATAVLVVLSLRIAPAAPERPPDRPSRPTRRGIAVRGIAVRVGVIAGVFALLLAAALWRRPGPGPPPGWSVAMCDVGQGDALVVRSGARSAVLVDVGPEPQAVDRCLSSLGVHRLDLIVLSHFHADHVLGLPGALRGREAGLVLVSPFAHPRQNVRAVQGWAEAVAQTPATLTQDVEGGAGTEGWQVLWTVLAPEPSPERGEPADLDESADGTVVNEASLVVLLDLHTPAGAHLRLAALGDLEVEGQRRLGARLAARGEGPVDVVKVAHHGSAKQDGALYRRLAPRVALIGVGAGNDYGHPARSALDLLAAQQIAVYRTDRDHLVAIGAEPPPAHGWGSPLSITRSRSRE
jgi:competence protein ComEC